MSTPAPRSSWFWPLVAGGFVALAIIVLTIVGRLPLGMVRILRPHTAPLDLRGGVRAVFRVPPDKAAQMDEASWRKLADTLRTRGSSIGVDVQAEHRGDEVIVDLDGATPADLDRFGAMTRPALLQFKMAEAGSQLMVALAQLANRDPEARALGITGSGDGWTHEETGLRFNDNYLRGPDPDVLTAWLSRVAAEDPSLAPDDRHEILYERVEPPDDARATRSYARTYLVEREAILDSRHLQDAQAVWDSLGTRPSVLLIFNTTGAHRFADATRRNIGRKMVIILDGQVKSAPVIQAAITGGRSTITMGAGDDRDVQRKAQDLANALRAGALPVPLELVTTSYVAQTLSPARVFLYGLIWALALGAAIIFAARLAQRLRLPLSAATATPTATPGSRSESIALWLRLAVTAGAVLLVNLADRVHLPRVNYAELRNITSGVTIRGDVGLGVFSLGVIPVLTAFVLVELTVLAIPAFRALRNGGPAGRARLAEPIAIVALVLACFQGWMLCRWLQTFRPYSGEVLDPGLLSTALVTLSLVAGMLALVVLASVVNRWGLVNGYSLILVAPLLGRPVNYVLGLFNMGNPSHTGFLGMMSTPEPPTLFERSIELGLYAGIALLTVWCLRRRARIEGGPSLRLPAAGVIPLHVGATLVAIVGLVAFLGVGFPTEVSNWLIGYGFHHYFAHAALIAFLAAGLTVLFALPLPPAGSATGRNTGPALAFAALISAAFVLAVDLATRMATRLPHFFFTPLEIAVATAVVADGIGEWIARRRLGPLVDVWPLHQVHDADRAAAALDAAGIPHHLRATGHRTLLQIFGPFVPVSILVPPDRAADAIGVLRGSLPSWPPKQS